MRVNTLWHDTRSLAYHLSQATSDESRINILQNFGTDRQVKKVLGFIFDRRVYRWRSVAGKPFLPDGMPPLPPKEARQIGPAPIESEGALRGMLVRDKIDPLFHTPFAETTKMEPYAQERLFIGMITDCHPDDRKLLVGIKDKVWVHADLYDLKPSLVGKAFPDILPIDDAASSGVVASHSSPVAVDIETDPFLIEEIDTVTPAPKNTAELKKKAAPAAKPGAKKPAAKKSAVKPKARASA